MNRIKELRIESGLTQAELASKIGINTVTLSRYENNARNPKIDKLEKIAEIFHVSTDYLTYKDNSRTGFGNHLDDLAKKMNEVNPQVDTLNENTLISNYRKLNDKGKKEAIKQVTNLTKITDYTE